MVWSKAKVMRQMVTKLRAVPNQGRVPERVYGGLEAGIVNVNGVALGSGTARSLVLMLR